MNEEAPRIWVHPSDVETMEIAQRVLANHGMGGSRGPYGKWNPAPVAWCPPAALGPRPSISEMQEM